MSTRFAVGERHPFRTLLAISTAAVAALTGCEGCDGEGLGRRDAVMVVTPDPISFDVISARDVATKTVRVHNAGSANLTLQGNPVLEEYGEIDHPALSIRNILVPVDCATGEPRESGDPHVLRPGDCRSLEVVYEPRVVGTTEGMLVFLSNDDDDRVRRNGRREIAITALADAPDIEVCLPVSPGCAAVETCYEHGSGEPLRMEFPLTAIAESRTCPVRVTNLGDLVLRSMAWGFTAGNRYRDFTLEPEDLTALELETGAGVQLEVSFSPVSGGERTGTLTLSSNDPMKPQIPIEVVGIGDGPKVCPDPMPVVQFGEVDVGTTEQKIVALENCGTMALEISNAWIQDSTGRQNSEDYFLPQGTPTSATLQPGESLDVPIDFSPRFAGAINGRLYFSSNDPIVPQAFVNLTGNGVIPPSCELMPSTNSLSFGLAAVGYDPAARTLAVTNTGELPCHTVTGEIGLGAAAEFRHASPSRDTQPFNLDPGETAVFNLHYAPQVSEQNHSGTFLVKTPDLGSDVVVQLSGTSTDQPTCNLNVTPRRQGALPDECISAGLLARTLQFGNIRTGQAKNMLVNLENVGSAPCKISSTSIKDTNFLVPSRGFRIDTPSNRVLVDGIPTDTIRPGETGIMRIEYAATREELGCGDLWIQTDDTSATNECMQPWGVPPTMGDPGCISIQLRGRGVRALVAAVPNKVDFGLITVDCLSPERDVNIHNIGGVPVQVSNISLTPAGTFRLAALPPLPVEIPAGSRLTLGLIYAPTGNPTTHTGTLTVTSDAENSPTVISLEGRSTTETYQVDLFQQLEEPQVDVLWVIDDSCSMQDIQNNLRDNIHIFMQRALDQNTDFHMAVITTDWEDQNKAGRFQSKGGWPRIIDRTVSDPVQAFRDNADVGTDGHHIEKGFDSAHMALTDPLLSGHNAGFLRDDAKLAIIFVSDEEEQSSASVDFFVDFFKSIKGHRNEALLSAHAVVGNHPGGCDNNHGSAQAAPRYIESANATGGLFRSICAPDWGQVADDMGLDAFAARREFFLSREPIEDSLVVQVNGSNVTRIGNWSYDPTSNSIVFATSAIPTQGSSIRVSYEVLCRK